MNVQAVCQGHQEKEPFIHEREKSEKAIFALDKIERQQKSL